MKKIIITATAESIEQVQALLEAGVDRIYVGEEKYGLRLPHNFTYDELNRISQIVQQAGKEMTVAVNALMHQDMIRSRTGNIRRELRRCQSSSRVPILICITSVSPRVIRSLKSAAVEFLPTG